jgi:DNA-directed RNA polymerase subunit RPC12/RpoP
MGMVQAICRNCSKSADSESFKLHYQIRMMVCPDCFSGRTQKQEERQEKVEKPKPPGWDVEDAYLEKISKQKKKEEASRFRKIPGTDHVIFNCPGCKFEFRYNPFTKRPRTCPYCNGQIPKLRTFSLL